MTCLTSCKKGTIMDKSDIAYLFMQGFSIEEIRAMDNAHNKETKPEESKIEGTQEVEKNEVKEEPKQEKKNSDSSELEDLKAENERLKKQIQEKNLESVEIGTPKEMTVEDVFKDFFEKP